MSYDPSEQSFTEADPVRTFDPVRWPELYDGVLARRIVAFAVDAFLIAVLMIPAFLLALALTIITFGLAWFLVPPLFVIVALGYVALTFGSPRSATIGMRLVGIEMRTTSGLRMYPLLALVHAVAFWISVSVLTPFILLVGLFSPRRRLLHDMLLGTVMLNTPPLERLEEAHML
jgi:uncharacterized RDD family membrane protein YckC